MIFLTFLKIASKLFSLHFAKLPQNDFHGILPNCLKKIFLAFWQTAFEQIS
jgi:hypothetical protein